MHRGYEPFLAAAVFSLTLFASAARAAVPSIFRSHCRDGRGQVSVGPEGDVYVLNAGATARHPVPSRWPVPSCRGIHSRITRVGTEGDGHRGQHRGGVVFVRHPRWRVHQSDPHVRSRRHSAWRDPRKLAGRAAGRALGDVRRSLRWPPRRRLRRQRAPAMGRERAHPPRSGRGLRTRPILGADWRCSLRRQCVAITEYSDRLTVYSNSGAFVGELGSTAGCGADSRLSSNGHLRTRFRSARRLRCSHGPAHDRELDRRSARDLGRPRIRPGPIQPTASTLRPARAGLIYVADRANNRVQVFGDAPTGSRDRDLGKAEGEVPLTAEAPSGGALCARCRSCSIACGGQANASHVKW